MKIISSISMYTAFLIRLCPSFHVAESPDFTGSKSGVVTEVKSARDLSEKLVHIIIIVLSA